MHCLSLANNLFISFSVFLFQPAPRGSKNTKDTKSRCKASLPVAYLFRILAAIRSVSLKFIINCC